MLSSAKGLLSRTHKGLRQFASTVSNIASTDIPEFAGDKAITNYADLHKLSVENPDRFWGTLARSRLRWIKDFNTVQQCDLSNGSFKWFLDGQLNITGRV